MRLQLVAWMALSLSSSCGGGDDTTPRAACMEAEATVNAAAKECDPQLSGRIDLSCQNFGTGSSCDAIDAYFDCLVKTSCDNGVLTIPTNCQLGACD